MIVPQKWFQKTTRLNLIEWFESSSVLFESSSILFEQLDKNPPHDTTLTANGRRVGHRFYTQNGVTFSVKQREDRVADDILNLNEFSPRNGGAFAVYKSVFSRQRPNCFGLQEKVFGGKFKWFQVTRSH